MTTILRLVYIGLRAEIKNDSNRLKYRRNYSVIF